MFTADDGNTHTVAGKLGFLASYEKIRLMEPEEAMSELDLVPY